VTTLAQWARAGRLPAAYTPDGHRRYRLADVQTLQAEREQKVPEPKSVFGKLISVGVSV
jgi:predicted site-specific integrase-resolvase